MNLRPYQKEQLELLHAAFIKGHKRIILCSPTGSGKSIVMAETIRQSYERGSRILTLTHRTELFKSMLSHIGRTGIPCVELDQGSQLPQGDWRVMIAMERTLWNRIRKGTDGFAKPNLIIVDEGHLNYFTKIIEAFPEAWVIMFTATPQGKHIHKLYTHLIQNIDIPELIDQGYLVPCKAYQMQDDIEIEQVKMKGADFDESDLFHHFDKTVIYQGLVREYRKFVPRQKGIVFCVNIEHTVKTYEMLLNEGLNAFMVHSGNANHPFSEDQRVNQVKAFEASSDGIMVNGGILTTGYDHDRIKWIGLYRATTSLPLFLQICGRGSRPILGPDGKADYAQKPHFTVLDFGSNHTRLGLWNQPRKWKIQDPKKAKKKRAAPVKTCDGCGAILAASARKCQFCSQEFAAPSFETIDGVMVEVGGDLPLGLSGKRISELDIDQLIMCQRTGRLKSSYIWRVLRTKEKSRSEGQSSFLGEYCKRIGYKSGWIYAQSKKIHEKGQTGFKNYILK